MKVFRMQESIKIEDEFKLFFLKLRINHGLTKPRREGTFKKSSE